MRFSNPPVVEVACGLAFDAVPGLRIAHIGLFWERVRSAFPRLEEAPALIGAGEGIALELEGFPIPRTWMVCEDGSALIQLQRNRLIYNWKAGGTSPYPSYDAVIIEFEKHLATFNAFMADEHLGKIEPSELELTYVNHIPLSFLAQDRRLLVDHARFEPEVGRFLPPPGKFFWSSVYPLPEERGDLHVVAQTVRSIASGEELIKMDMCAKGFPSDGMAQREWFDLAHVWITKGFVDLTSPETQLNIWGRTS